MKSIMVTYPGFQDLPKTIKRMLLVSEDFFFGDTAIEGSQAVRSSGTVRLSVDAATGLAPHIPVWRWRTNRRQPLL